MGGLREEQAVATPRGAGSVVWGRGRGPGVSAPVRQQREWELVEVVGQGVHGNFSEKRARRPLDLADHWGVVGPRHGRPSLLVGVVAEELPCTGAVLAGALDD